MPGGARLDVPETLGEILSALKELDIGQNTLLFSLRIMAPLAEAATLLCPLPRNYHGLCRSCFQDVAELSFCLPGRAF